MFKKLFASIAFLLSIFVLLLCLAPNALFAGDRFSADYMGVSQQGMVSVSSSAWTPVKSSTTLTAKLVAMSFDVPSTWTTSVVLRFEQFGSSPTVNISTGLYLSPADTALTLPIANNLIPWARTTLTTGATDFFFIEWTGENR